MEENCLHEFVSHIDGKNATVRVFPTGSNGTEPVR